MVRGWRVAVGTAGLVVAAGASLLAAGSGDGAAAARAVDVERVAEIERIAEIESIGECRLLAAELGELLDGGRLTAAARTEVAALQDELASGACVG